MRVLIYTSIFTLVFAELEAEDDEVPAELEAEDEEGDDDVIEINGIKFLDYYGDVFWAAICMIVRNPRLYCHFFPR